MKTGLLLSLLALCGAEAPSEERKCAYDEQRYGLKRLVLAVEDHPLRTLQPDNFEGLTGAVPQLESLILRRDEISLIFPDSFRHVRGLKCLDLSRNALALLPDPAAFRGLSKLQALLLARNQIAHLPESVFISTGALRILDLSHNGLRRVEDAALRGLGELEELDLEDNELRSLPPLLFHHTPRLKTLRVGRNPLRTLSVAFLPDLLVFSAFSTQLGALPKLPSTLKQLDARSANLSSLSLEAGVSLSKSAARLRLGGNPFHCDCPGLAWLAPLSIRLSNILDAPEATCGGPPSLAGIEVSSAFANLPCGRTTATPERPPLLPPTSSTAASTSLPRLPATDRTPFSSPPPPPRGGEVPPTPGVGVRTTRLHPTSPWLFPQVIYPPPVTEGSIGDATIRLDSDVRTLPKDDRADKHSALSAVTILLGLGIGVIFTVIVVALAVSLRRYRRNRELGRLAGRLGAPVFTVGPLHNDIIMRPGYSIASRRNPLPISGPLLHGAPPASLSSFDGGSVRSAYVRAEDLLDSTQRSRRANIIRPTLSPLIEPMD